jgi:hypothetical protein
MRLAERFGSCCLDFLLALFGIAASPSLNKSSQSFNCTIMMPLSDKPKSGVGVSSPLVGLANHVYSCR